MRIIFTIWMAIVGCAVAGWAQTADSCSMAISLDDLIDNCSGEGEYSLSGKTHSGLENPSCFPQDSGEKDVWFQFVPKYQNINIVIRGDTRYPSGNTLKQPQMALYQGGCDDLILLSCISDNHKRNFVELTVGDLKLGQSYYLRVSSRNNSEGKFQLCINNFQFDPSHSSDCFDATVLCDKSTITVDLVTGTGQFPDEAKNTCLDVNPVTGKKDGISEYSSVWFKWVAKNDGRLTFTLDPLNPVDDLDFALFELPGGLDGCDRKKLLRCMASGENVGADFSEWEVCTGPTGLREGETHTSEERGCQEGNTNFLAPLEMEEGRAYALLVNNFSQSGSGFRLEWGGDGEFAGPEAQIVFLDDRPVYCPGDGISFYAEDVGIGGKITEYNWVYTDDTVSHELSGPGIHKVFFSTGGLKPIVLSVKNDAGCVISLDTVIEVENPIEIIGSMDRISCNGYDDGRIEVDINSPSPLQAVFWKDGGVSMTRDSLGPGSYVFHVRNELGCSSSETFDLEEPLPIQVNEVTINASCGGGSDGSINLTGDGTFPPFQYDFNDGSGYTDQSIKEGVSAGRYSIAVRDSMGCERDTLVFVNEIDLLIHRVVDEEPSCYGGENGRIVIEVEGGNEPYEFDLGTTGTFHGNNRFEDLPAGDYVVAIRDQDQCLAYHLLPLGQPDSISFEVDTTGLACYGDKNGALKIQADGGTPDFTYEWDIGESGSKITNISAGSYRVLITDRNGCEKSGVIEFPEPPELLLSLKEKRDLICYGDKNGFIHLESTGGTGVHEYSFQSDEFIFKPNYSLLPAGDYNAVVRDENGCKDSLAVTLSQPEQIRVHIMGERDFVSIATIKLGENINLRGSYAPRDRIIEWEWNPPEVVDCAACQNIHTLPVKSTRYRLTGTDQNGCTGEDLFLVNVIPLRTVGIPNVIRPGREDSNGYVTLYGGGHVAQIRELNIFDRWGNLLFSRKAFQPNEYLLGWDGTAGGATLIPGVYVYTADVEFLDGVVESFSGEILLLN